MWCWKQYLCKRKNLEYRFFLNAIGLLIGFVAAILMYYFPPRITLYTQNGEPYVQWVSGTTEIGKRRGLCQRNLSIAAPWLLAMAFLFQLVSTILSALPSSHG